MSPAEKLQKLREAVETLPPDVLERCDGIRIELAGDGIAVEFHPPLKLACGESVRVSSRDSIR